MGILEIRNITLKLDGSKILDDLSIDFWEGHVHAVVGPNGAGKTTLANTIMGLEGYRNISGDIILEGESIRNLSVDERARRGITLGWQEPARFEGLPLRDYISASSRNPKPGDIEDLLTRVGLSPSDYLDRAVDRTLSGGERKKIELASILAMKPEIAILDEPDSGIDVESLEKIFDAVRILKKQGTTVLLITHSQTVLKQAEHAFLLCCGRLQKKGVVSEIEQYFGDKCIPCDHKNNPDLNEE
ncbi:MAG: ATP-binding cassette domain-containing protein [Candidatus Latescibacteria bacterium]|nr:ATP-binding cassette domain-containing protein [bacterium]MBD3424687.1 ATP-binding cassette domain-containing protein [Candidatus Latescibacterota bacterium]